MINIARDYVVQTHPCSEVLAKMNLEAKGFEVYLPTVVEEIRTGRMREKRTTTLAPLFPGYIFARFSLGNPSWRKIISIRGVRRVLGRDSEHPAALPIGALDDLRERYAAGEFVNRVSTYRICAGDQVKVTQGPFEGHMGVCTISRAERIEVLLSLLGGTRKVTMASDGVMVAVSA